MPRPIRVVPEDLHTSATKVDNHAEELEARHTSAHGRIEAAQVGTPAVSAAALSAAVAKWQTDSSTLVGNLLQHGEGLRGAAVRYTSTEESNTSDVTAVGNEASTTGADL